MWVGDLVTFPGVIHLFDGMNEQAVWEKLTELGFQPYGYDESRRSDAMSLSWSMRQRIYVTCRRDTPLDGDSPRFFRRGEEEPKGEFRVYYCRRVVFAAKTAGSTMDYSLKNDFWPDRQGVN